MKSKYNWSAIAEDYKSDMPIEDICEKYKIIRSWLYNKMRLLKINRQTPRRIFNFQEIELFRNRYYTGDWVKTPIKKIAKSLNVHSKTMEYFLSYKTYIKELNLTTEQIKELHSEMKRKRAELRSNK